MIALKSTLSAAAVAFGLLIAPESANALQAVPASAVHGDRVGTAVEPVRYYRGGHRFRGHGFRRHGFSGRHRFSHRRHGLRHRFSGRHYGDHGGSYYSRHRYYGSYGGFGSHRHPFSSYRRR